MSHVWYQLTGTGAPPTYQAPPSYQPAPAAPSYKGSAPYQAAPSPGGIPPAPPMPTAASPPPVASTYVPAATLIKRDDEEAAKQITEREAVGAVQDVIKLPGSKTPTTVVLIDGEDLSN
ncbi:hypothetical protein TELCIR_10795 [Teladorsagia circumcincta]|uniref:Uncharacterized protein n=1 Tax=Teladorsagia circumcincta TaxID=45464 RepID=A0A2G9UB67_TELCI|nr:hypothetical protein TELCIR_10795 [Teladorsagia circumcincta]